MCKAWRRELEARGFCNKTTRLCSALAGGRNIVRLSQNARRRMNASTGDDTVQAVCMDGIGFLDKSEGWGGGLGAWLQAASQEPAASFLSRGAASTAQILGLPLVQWVGKPEGRYSGVCTLMNPGMGVLSVAISSDGTRIVSGSDDGVVRIWDVATGALVSSFVEVS